MTDAATALPAHRIRMRSLLPWLALAFALTASQIPGIDAGTGAAWLAELRQGTGATALVLLAIVYAAALALPFVPGMEIGLLIMLVFGPAGAVVAWISTVCGLGAAYAAGRLLPPHLIPQRLRGATACAAPLGATGGWRTRPSCAGWLHRHRHVALALCLNLPGNALVGGGGGIALLCGMSRRFSAWRYLATVALATSPLPLLVLAGLPVLDRLAG